MTKDGPSLLQKELPVALGERRFCWDDQVTFGRLSGDINPIHMDRLASRRSVVGAMVVHGIHTLLWSLDVLAKSEFRPTAIRLIDVRFPKAIYLADEVKLSLQSRTLDEAASLVRARSPLRISALANPRPLWLGERRRIWRSKRLRGPPGWLILQCQQRKSQSRFQTLRN